MTTDLEHLRLRELRELGWTQWLWPWPCGRVQLAEHNLAML